MGNVFLKEVFILKLINSWEYLRAEATALENEGFGFEGRDTGVAIGEDGWAEGFATVVSAHAVAIKGDPIDFARKPRGNFNNGKLGPLGRVSSNDKFDASLVALTALTLFFNPFGIGGEKRVVASIATEEATSWLAGGEVGGVSLLARFNVVTAALGPLSDLFIVEEPPCVLIIFLV